MDEKLEQIFEEILDLNAEIEVTQRDINERVQIAKDLYGDNKIERDSIMDNILSYKKS